MTTHPGQHAGEEQAQSSTSTLQSQVITSIMNNIFDHIYQFPLVVINNGAFLQLLKTNPSHPRFENEINENNLGWITSSTAP